MRFVARISSFLLDSAVALFGAAIMGMSVTMFDHDIQTAKKESKKHD